jgi:hypothetical protein
MRRALKIIGWWVGVAATFLAVSIGVSWCKRHLDWFVPVKGATLTIDGVANRGMSLFRSSSAFFALAADRTMVLIRNNNGEKQTYVMLGPGPGHLPEGFKGAIRRCDSVFIATPLFGVGGDRAECVVPANSRDGKRDAVFGARFVQFTADDGRRVKVEW